LDRFKRPVFYDFNRERLEVDNNGWVVEYDKDGQKYEKDVYGNIKTFDSNGKEIRRNEKAYMIEYD